MKNPQLEEVKSQLINTALKWLLLFFIPVVIIQTLRIEEIGLKFVMIYGYCGFILLTITYFFRKNISCKIRGSFYVGFFFFLGVFSFLDYGPYAGGAIWLILTSIFSSLIFNKRTAYWIIAACIFVVIIFSIVYSQNILIYQLENNYFTTSRNSWISKIMEGVFIISTIFFSNYKIYKYLLNYQDELFRKNEALNELNQQLEEEIENRRNIELALKESEDRYKRLAEATFEAIVISKDGNIIDANKQVQFIYGYSQEEFMQKTFADIVHPDDLELVLKNIKCRFTEPYIHRGIKKDGSVLFLETSAKYFKRNNVENRLEVLRDITNYLETLTSLGESEEKYRTLFEKANDGIVLYGDGMVLDCNQKVLELLGVNRSEIIGKNPFSFMPQYQSDGMVSNIKANEIIESAEKMIPQIFEWTVEKKNGGICYLEISLNNVGELIGKHRLLGFVRDITERKLAEQTIINSEKKFRNIFNSVFDVVFIFDIDGNILEINDVAIYLLGYSKEELLEMKAKDLVGNDQYQMLIEKKEKIFTGELGILEINHITKSGKIIPFEVTTVKIKYDEEDAVISVGRDITQRKQMQQSVYRAMIESEEKERERYAKELHDGLGPILSTCKIYFHTIKVMPYGPKLKEHVKRAGELLEDALQGIKEISNNLSPHMLRNYGLSEALYAFVDKLESIVTTKFSIGSNFNNRLPEIIEFTLYRTLVELINNSLKHSRATTIQIKILKEGTDLSIVFTDNGIGLDYESIKRQSKGFGLLNLETRIKEIGGNYNYISFPGKGVKVYINLKYLDSWLK